MASRCPKVVVTDMGLVTSSGMGVDAAWSRIEEGRTCIREVRTFDAGAFPNALGAELESVPQAGRQGESRPIHLLLAAARTFETDLRSFLKRERSTTHRTGVVLGTSKGAVLGMAEVHRRFADGVGKMSLADAETVDTYRPGYGANRLAEDLGIRGPRSSVGLACASSSMAIIQAAELIRTGVADRVIAGGFDGFSPFIFTGFHMIGAMSHSGCRPFDVRRDGTVLGEGAALVVLESEEAAEARGARPIALYGGGGFAGDGVHLTAPDKNGSGLVRAVNQAFDDASVSAEHVGYVNAHGTATKFNDAMECEAFRRVFSERDIVPPISSIKSIFGHTLGAAGALDAIASIMAMRRQMLPPTVNGAEEPLVEGWDFVLGRGRPVSDLDCVLTTNSGFAGNNTAIVFQRSADAPDPPRRPLDRRDRTKGRSSEADESMPAQWDGVAT